jgi:hypothetical protein
MKTKAKKNPRLAAYEAIPKYVVTKYNPVAIGTQLEETTHIMTLPELKDLVDRCGTGRVVSVFKLGGKMRLEPLLKA